MRDSPERSTVAVVRALVYLSWLRFRHSLGWPGKILTGMRQPTRGKNSRGAWFLLIIGGIFFVQAFWLSRMMVVNYADRSIGNREGIISLDHQTFEYLAAVEADVRQMSDEEFSRTMTLTFYLDPRDRTRRGHPSLTSEEVFVQLKEKGMAGFRDYEAISKGSGTLQDLLPHEIIRFERLIGMILLASLSALLFMPLALRERDLAATNDHLEWLFSLPLKGTELLLGKFVSISLIRPLAYLIIWPIVTNILILQGGGIAMSVSVALAVAFLVSVALSGLEILLDSWLRSRGSARMVKNVQMIFSITGLLSFYAVLAACFANEPSFPWVNWLATRLPGALGQPLGGLVLETPATIFAAAFFAALGFGAGGFLGASRLMQAGLLSGNVQQARMRGVQSNDLRESGLLRFEWLLLLRDRALATQVVMVPVLLVVYQLLVNPSMIEGATVGGICAMAYGCGTYASLVTAPQLLMSEVKGVWLIYNLPVPIAAYFRRRETVWRTVATTLAGIFVTAMIFWTGAFKLDEIWRYLAALAGVWVMGRLVSGIVMGKPEMPDAASGERPKVNFGRMYGAMILSAIYGGLLWRGEAWPLVSALVIFWFLGIAIWHRREISFSYLMEPTEKEPPSWGVDDGLWAVVVFFVVQVAVALIAGMSGEIGSGVILVSFVAGGVVALLFGRLRIRSKGLPLPAFDATEERTPWSRIWMETAVAIVVCLGVGVLWTMVLKAGYFLDPDQMSAGSFNIDPWILALLAVVAAPLLEEPLFRGFVCRTMLGFWSRKHAVIGSALIFAIVHPGTSFPPVFLLGLASAVLFVRSRSILPGIVLHALYNLGIVTLAMFG